MQGYITIITFPFNAIMITCNQQPVHAIYLKRVKLYAYFINVRIMYTCKYKKYFMKTYYTQHEYIITFPNVRNSLRI